MSRPSNARQAPELQSCNPAYRKWPYIGQLVFRVNTISAGLTMMDKLLGRTDRAGLDVHCKCDRFCTCLAGAAQPLQPLDHV